MGQNTHSNEVKARIACLRTRLHQAAAFDARTQPELIAIIKGILDLLGDNL